MEYTEKMETGDLTRNLLSSKLVVSTDENHNFLHLPEIFPVQASRFFTSKKTGGTSSTTRTSDEPGAFPSGAFCGSLVGIAMGFFSSCNKNTNSVKLT